MSELSSTSRKLAFASFLAVALAAASPLLAQESATPAAAPTDLGDLGYLIGEWTLHSYSREDSGPWVEADSTTSYRARYLHDGLSIMAEYYGDSPEGFYGVHLISRSAEGELVHDYLNARANRRLEFRGRFGGGEYHLYRPGGYGGGDFLYREVDSEITPGSFVKRTYQSHDDGESWVEGNYYFRFERVEPATGFRVVGSSFFALQVTDAAAAAGWYRAALGLSEVNRIEAEDGAYSIRLLAGPGLTVELIRMRGAEPASEPHLGLFKAGFSVDDIEAAFDWLRTHGAATDDAIFRDEALGARSFLFRDPDGNRLQVFEPEDPHRQE